MPREQRFPHVNRLCLQALGEVEVEVPLPVVVL